MYDRIGWLVFVLVNVDRDVEFPDNIPEHLNHVEHASGVRQIHRIGEPTHEAGTRASRMTFLTAS